MKGKTMNDLKVRFYNSSFWYHAYYKHTKKHKKELSDTYNRVTKRINAIIRENKPLESEGYWVGCCGSPECAESGEDPTFKIQIVDDIAYIYCTKCGSFRTLTPQSKLHLSGIRS